MQPLYTVDITTECIYTPTTPTDHETRHNSANHAEEERQPTAAPTENSPLIQHYPEYVHPRNPVTTIIVSFLLLILVAGVIIGIYLLVIQNDSENILPPVETPLHLVARTQWDHSNLSHVQDRSPYTSEAVMVVQTHTDPCWNTRSCITLLQTMKANATSAKSIMPYNFLISSDGQTYEALGWHHSTSISSQKSFNGLVLALIGNFSATRPSELQMREAKHFFAMAVSQQHLHSSFRITRKNVYDSPAGLSESFKNFPQWSNELAENITK